MSERIDSDAYQESDLYNRNLYYLDKIEAYESRYKRLKLKEYWWQAGRKPLFMAPLIGALATLDLRGEEMGRADTGAFVAFTVASAFALRSMAKRNQHQASQDAYQTAERASLVTGEMGIARGRWIIEGLSAGSPEVRAYQDTLGEN